MPVVGMFVTCLVGLPRPVVGFAAIHLLEQAGCAVSVAEAQFCCGQPAHTSDANDTARRLHVLLFEDQAE